MGNFDEVIGHLQAVETTLTFIAELQIRRQIQEWHATVQTKSGDNLFVLPENEVCCLTNYFCLSFLYALKALKFAS